jgi:hypothetical protein
MRFRNSWGLQSYRAHTFMNVISKNPIKFSCLRKIHSWLWKLIEKRSHCKTSPKTFFIIKGLLNMEENKTKQKKKHS